MQKRIWKPSGHQDEWQIDMKECAEIPYYAASAIVDMGILATCLSVLITDFHVLVTFSCSINFVECIIEYWLP